MIIKEKSIDSALFLSAPGDWDKVVEAMKPGAHLLLFSDVKKHHAGTIAAEDNGLEIRDTIAWVYDSGEPTPEMFMVTVARKPLEGTVAENTLKYGTGGLNIDGCRVELNGDYKCKANGRPSQTGLSDNYDPFNANQPDTQGRWPANLIHDGSDEVVGLFPAEARSSCGGGRSANAKSGYSGGFRPDHDSSAGQYYDSGSAARFFYSVPHLNDLLKYLLKLITPPGGTVLTNCENILAQSAYPPVKYDED